MLVLVRTVSQAFKLKAKRIAAIPLFCFPRFHQFLVISSSLFSQAIVVTQARGPCYCWEPIDAPLALDAIHFGANTER